MVFELNGQIDRHLRDDKIVWLTTVTSLGRPAPRPVWFVWDGTHITTFSEPDTAKLRHIAANDQVSLNFNCTPGGRDVATISGRAEVLEGTPPPSAFPGLLDKYLDTIRGMGNSQDWYDKYSITIRITPERAWAFE